MSNDRPPSNEPERARGGASDGAANLARSIGRYDVVAPLASGGMGELFLARRSGAAGFARLVVLKRLRPELGATATYRDMFFDEARLAARLTHPNVCEVHDLEEHAGDHFLAMPYLEGVPASALLPPDGAVDAAHVRLVAGILVQVCDGLHHAHELRGDDGAPLGVVHRDVSPGNVFVTTDGIVKLLDFGIAKVRGQTATTDQGVVKGKLSHMSPEQLAGGSVDRRADLFCVGILGWEGLMNRALFSRGSPTLTAAAVLDEPIAAVDAPAVPPALSAALASALAREPRRRPATAAALRDAIDAAMSSLGGPMRPAELAHVLESRCAPALESQRARIRSLPSVDVAAPRAAVGSSSGSPASSDSPASRDAALAPPARAASADHGGPITRPERPDALATTVWIPSHARRSRLPWIAAAATALAAVAVIAWLATRDERDAPSGLMSGTDTSRARDQGSNPLSDSVPVSVSGSGSVPVSVSVSVSGPVPVSGSVPVSVSGSGSVPGSGSGSVPVSGSGSDAVPDTAATSGRAGGDAAAKARPGPGFVSIDSTPWANLYVGGKRVGITPYIHKPMAAGKQKFKAVLEDGREKTFTVNVPAGREAEPVMLRW